MNKALMSKTAERACRPPQVVKEADLQALSVLIIEREGSCPEDEGLAMQHVVLPDHDLHEGLAPTEVQEGPPASIQSPLLTWQLHVLYDSTCSSLLARIKSYAGTSTNNCAQVSGLI